jgi:prepilin-type processing-associated H-X9-DG protein
MIKYYNKLFICAVLFFSISIAQPGVARAESPPVDKLATVLPDDVLVFVATSGGDHLKPAFEKSILGRIWYDPGVQTFYQSIQKELLANIKQEIPNFSDAKVPDIVMDFVQLVGSRPIIIGAAQKTATDGPPVYGFAILDAGTRKAEIASAITKMEALADEGDIAEIKVGSFMMHGPKDDAGVPGYWGWVGNYLVFAINDGEGLALKYLQRPRAAAASYLKEVSGTSDVLAVYLDWQKITGVVTAVAGQEGATNELDMATVVIKELGFANMKTITSRVGFAGPDVVCNELLEVPQPRTGMFGCFKSINLKMFDMVDARAVNAAAVNCDIAGVYDTIMRTIKVAVPSNFYTEIQQVIAEFESEAKFNIREGLLESLSGPMIFYSLPAGVMMEAPSGGFVVIAKSKDAALLEKTMVSLGKFAATLSEGMLQVSSQVQSDGRTLHSWMIAPLAMMQVMPCWAVVDDHIVIASNATLYNVAVKQIVSTGPGKKSLRTTEGYKKATAKVADNLIFLRYTDSKVQFTQLMTTLQQYWPMVTMVATQAGVKLPIMLPPVADIVKDMGPSCQYAWFDAQGLRSHYRGPGVEVGLVAVGGASVGVAIMMPAMSRTRGQAQRIVSSSNLRQIGICFAMYADDHGGKFPEDLQEMKAYYRDPKLLESPRKPKDFDGPSYIYVKGHSLNTRRAAEYIVVYENPEFCSDKINVLFLDFHVQAMGPDEFLRKLEATYKRLGRKMPEVKFKSSRKISSS